MGAKRNRITIDRAFKKAEAVKYRRQGMSLSQIADKLGYAPSSRAAVKHLIDEALTATYREDVDAVRIMALERLAEAGHACFKIMRSDKTDDRVQLEAIRTLIAVMDREARYLPELNAPIEVDVKTYAARMLRDDPTFTDEERDQIARDVERFIEEAQPA